MIGSAVGAGIFICNGVKHTYTDAHCTRAAELAASWSSS